METILIVRFGRMGDFLVALPALAALRARQRGRRLVLVTGLAASGAARGLASRYSGSGVPPWVDAVAGTLVDEVIAVRSVTDPREWSALRKRMAELRVVAACVLPYGTFRRRSEWKRRLWLWSLGIRGPIVTGPTHDMTERLGRPAHVSTQMWKPYVTAMCVAPPPGAPAADTIEFAPYTLSVDPAAAQWARDIVPVAASPRIALYPGATRAHKRWPGDRFAAVARELGDTYGAHFVLVGTEAERPIALESVKGLRPDQFTDLCGRTQFPQLAEVLRTCDLFVGNDGGIAHLAAAVGTRGVTVMSGVHVERMWDPSLSGSVSVRVSVPCAGCLNEVRCPRGDSACVQGIEVATVSAACHAVLAAGKRSRA